jgi:peroxiredoxin
MKALWTLLALSFLIPNPALAQEVDNKTPPPSTDRSRSVRDGGSYTGQRIRSSVWVGEGAPEFELDASTGERIRLSTLHGSWVLLVFAERKEHLSKFNSIEADLLEHGIRMIGVCDEKAHHLRAYAEKGLTTFPLLADVTNEISALYGLYDSIRGSIQPGFFVIDEMGVVQMALIGRQLPGKDMAGLALYASAREAP